MLTCTYNSHAIISAADQAGPWLPDRTTQAMNADRYVKIAVLENEIEAQVVAAVLADHGLPHLIRSYHDTAYDGLFQFQLGWGELRAPQSEKREILELLENIRDQDRMGPPPETSGRV